MNLIVLNLVHQLLLAYLACLDRKFVRYMETKQNNSYEDAGAMILMAKGLMNAARQKYSTLINNGEWQAEAETKESHNALQDKFKKLQSSELKNLKRERNPIAARKEKAIHAFRQEERPEGWMENDQAQTRGALNHHSQKEIIPLV